MSRLGHSTVVDSMPLPNTVVEARPHSSQAFVSDAGRALSGMDRELVDITRKLTAYCQEHHWSGYDPYDALNSRLFQHVPFLQNRLPQIALTQLLRRSPLNLRRLLLIPQTQNAKAIALFLSAYLKLETIGLMGPEDLPSQMIERLIALRSPGARYCWGYSFPWQGRTILVPAGTPNLVCTTFVANSLLDAYDLRGAETYLQMAVSAAEYILNELYWTQGESAAGFSYPLPGLKGQTYNANFLAAALLCRISRHTGETKFVEPALRAARYAARGQQADGSWFYGEAPSQRWIDNFHTGYNLCSLQSIGSDLGTDEFETSLRNGFEFYRNHFFRSNDSAPKYFHDRDYPIDIHCVAQSIITLATLQDLDPNNLALARSVLHWVRKHMWDEHGFFYYRVLRLLTIRTSYMRWSQAWMLLALSTLLGERQSKAPFKTAAPAPNV